MENKKHIDYTFIYLSCIIISTLFFIGAIFYIVKFMLTKDLDSPFSYLGKVGIATLGMVIFGFLSNVFRDKSEL